MEMDYEDFSDSSDDIPVRKGKFVVERSTLKKAPPPPPSDSTHFFLKKHEKLFTFRGDRLRIKEETMLDEEFIANLSWRNVSVSAKGEDETKTIFTLDKDKDALVAVLVNGLCDENRDDDSLKLLRLFRECDFSGVDASLKPGISNVLLTTRSMDPKRWGLPPRDQPKKDEAIAAATCSAMASLNIAAVLLMPKQFDDLVKLFFIGQHRFDEPEIFAHVLFWSLAAFNRKIYETIHQAKDVQLLEMDEIIEKLSLRDAVVVEKMDHEKMKQWAMNGILALSIPGKQITEQNYKKWPQARVKAFLKSLSTGSCIPNDEIDVADVKFGTIAGAKRYREMINHRRSLLENYTDWLINGVKSSGGQNKNIEKMFKAVCYQTKLVVEYFEMATIQFTYNFVRLGEKRCLNAQCVREEADRFKKTYKKIWDEEGYQRFPYLGYLRSPRLLELSKKKYPNLVYCSTRFMKKDPKTKEPMRKFGFLESRALTTTTQKKKLRKLVKRPLKLSPADKEKKQAELFESLGIDLGTTPENVGAMFQAVLDKIGGRRNK